MWNVNFARPLLFHILVIARQFGTFVGLEIKINYSMLTKGRSGLFWMRSLCTTRSHWADLILVICIALPRCQDMRCRSTHVVFFKWGILRSRKLVIPYINTTTYGLNSFRYISANMWNKLTEGLRSLTSFNEFRTKICQVSFKHQCNCYLRK